MAWHKNDLKVRRVDPLMDEVYRQMLRLEAGYPGAEMGLALALLRSWIDTDTRAGSVAMRRWFRAICPVCVGMIEESLNRGSTVAVTLLTAAESKRET